MGPRPGVVCVHGRVHCLELKFSSVRLAAIRAEVEEGYTWNLPSCVFSTADSLVMEAEGEEPSQGHEAAKW